MTCLLISKTFRTKTEETHVKPHRTFGRITNCGPKFQTSVCKISGLDLDPYSFACTVPIDCTLLSAKCHRHPADTYRLSATAGSDVTQQCEIIEGELLLASSCVCNTGLDVRVDLMFWICMLVKTTFSISLVWRPSIIQLSVYRWSSFPAELWS